MTPIRSLPVARSRPAPQDDDELMNRLLQVRCSPTLREAIAAEARQLGVSDSDFARMAIIAMINRIRKERGDPINED